MVINSNGVRDQLKKYITSGKMQKKIAKSEKIKYLTTEHWTLSEIEQEISTLKNILKKYAVKLTKHQYDKSSSLTGLDPNALILHKITNIKRDQSNREWITSCKVNLFFNPEFVKRASLVPSRYPNGVDNILRLLTNGWDFRSNRAELVDTEETESHFKNIYGEWRVGGFENHKVIKKVYAQSYRYPNSALFDAIAEFNAIPRAKESKPYAYLNYTYVNVFGIGNFNPRRNGGLFSDYLATYNLSDTYLDNKEWRYIKRHLIDSIGIINFGSRL